MNAARAHRLPLRGILVGLVGAAVYWLAMQLWPSSVAVIVALAATLLFDARRGGHFRPPPLVWSGVLILFVKYNALMALTAANLPFRLPANVALGFIMVCGQSASHGLAASMAAQSASRTASMSVTGLTVALLLGFAPAAALGIPGLAGLGAALTARLALVPVIRQPRRPPLPTTSVRDVTETCFYLGALATWTYV